MFSSCSFVSTHKPFNRFHKIRVDGMARGPIKKRLEFGGRPNPDLHPGSQEFPNGIFTTLG